jgi:hypothetical protein
VLARNEAPTVLVSTEPAAVVESSGEPDLVPVPGTRLLWAKNTDADLFLDPASNELYVLLSGRWFRSSSRSGPWAFVPARELPDEFARIPEDAPAAGVLVCVPGTPQAQDAVLETLIPETTSVRTGDVALAVDYDGEPAFEPVVGTNLSYALNTSSAVLACDARFYACEQGLWLTSGKPRGPWAVADRIPDAVEAIPPSSAVYFVKYVKIYEAKPDHVVTGYTPGYLGAYASSDGTLVWGTGFTHRGWTKKAWVERPATYGHGAAVHWVPGRGATVGLGVVSRPAGRPAWSPLGKRAAAFAPVVGAREVVFPNLLHSNVYNSSRAIMRPASPRAAPSSPARASSKLKGPDLYAAEDGTVFRRGASWLVHGPDGWARPRIESSEATARLDAAHAARDLGAARAVQVHETRQSSPVAPGLRGEVKPVK